MVVSLVHSSQAEMQNKVDDIGHAYVYYKRWVSLTQRTIPGHNYYNDQRFKKEKLNLKRDMEYVILQLQARDYDCANKHIFFCRQFYEYIPRPCFLTLA